MIDNEPTSRFSALRDAPLDEREQALPWVEEQLSAGPKAQVGALELLGYWGEMRHQHIERRLAEAVEARVESEHPGVRKEACAALALIRTEPRFDPGPTLIGALRDPDAEVRQEAAAALGDKRVANARSALVRGLEDPHPAVRFECAFALSAFSDGAARDVLEGALDQIAFRAFAIEGLRRLGDPDACPPLLRIARSWTLPWPERLAAWAALASLGEPKGIEELQRRARRGRLEVRSYAVFLIGHARLREAKPILEEVADDPRSRIRATAVQALAKLNDPGDEHRLKALALDKDVATDVRLEALDALAARGRTADLRAWLGAERFDDDAEVRERARELTSG